MLHEQDEQDVNPRETTTAQHFFGCTNENIDQDIFGMMEGVQGAGE